ncbi:hypothetical protein MEQU1_001820 [Malassezia equina]|uniref:Uncharacterized protein n=1 Tax=Malassezia equina TaxID=1381935 RepID=A0AAF0EDC5_9BASI|nr:hypothetical protein MEQU1_001820 [Malassezia equina]
MSHPSKENMGLGYHRRPTANRLSSIPHSHGFDSLQDLLEREGYKETRIVTPVGKIPTSIVAHGSDDVEMADVKAPAIQDSKKPKQARSASFQSETKHNDIQAWMEGILLSQSHMPEEPVRRRHREPPLLKTRSDADLRSRTLRRRSSLWDASVAYRSGAAKPANPIPPVPPLPPALAKKPASDWNDASLLAAPKASVTLTTEAPPQTNSTMAFLSTPAEPVLSRHDAVVQVVEKDPTASLPRGIRRSKSEDLLHKALKSRRAQKPEMPPTCTCGRNTVKFGTVEPRWHMHDCPIRSAWEATAPEPVPPPPPRLTISTPRGVSAPKHLDLAGREYDPLDVPGNVAYLLRFSQPGIGLVKRATLAGLNGLFKSQEKVPMTMNAGSHSPSQPLRKPSVHRLSRTASLPRTDAMDTGSAALMSSGQETSRLDGKPMEGARSGSQRIHELRQHVEERMRQDEASSLVRVKAQQQETPPPSDHGLMDMGHAWESPTLQRQLRRGPSHVAHNLTDMFASSHPDLSNAESEEHLPATLSSVVDQDKPAPRIVMPPSAVPSISVLQTMTKNDAKGPISSPPTADKPPHPPATIRRMPSRCKAVNGSRHVLRPSSQGQIPAVHRSQPAARVVCATPSSDTLRNLSHAPL